MRFGFIKNILIISLLLAAILFLPSLTNIFYETTGVKGTSTKKGADVPEKITEDIKNHTNTIKKNILDMKVSDVIDGMSAVSKIPQDFKKGEQYIREMLDDVIKSEK